MAVREGLLALLDGGSEPRVPAEDRLRGGHRRHVDPQRRAGVHDPRPPAAGRLRHQRRGRRPEALRDHRRRSRGARRLVDHVARRHAAATRRARCSRCCSRSRRAPTTRSRSSPSSAPRSPGCSRSGGGRCGLPRRPPTSPAPSSPTRWSRAPRPTCAGSTPARRASCAPAPPPPAHHERRHPWLTPPPAPAPAALELRGRRQALRRRPHRGARPHRRVASGSSRASSSPSWARAAAASRRCSTWPAPSRIPTPGHVLVGGRDLSTLVGHASGRRCAAPTSASCSSASTSCRRSPPSRT